MTKPDQPDRKPDIWDAIGADPWKPVICPDCGTSVLHLQDIACETCEILGETLEYERKNQSTP